MVKIGVIGTSAMGSAIVEGLLGHAAWPFQVWVSNRNSAQSYKLSSKFNNVIRAEAETIVAKCSVIILAVRSEQVQKICQRLVLRPDQTLVSLATGIDLPRLRHYCRSSPKIVRAYPLPPIVKGIGPILIYPREQDVEHIFSQIGEVMTFDDEAQFHAYTCAGAFMAMFFEVTATSVCWLTKHGAKPEQSKSYVTSLVHAIAVLTQEFDAERLELECQNCLTSVGLSEGALQSLHEVGWFTAVEEEMTAIYQRHIAG